MISFSASTEAMVELFYRNCRSINDRRLVAWLRLQLIAEDIENMKRNAEMRFDPSFIDASSIKNDFSLFQDRLKSWENALDPVLWIGKESWYLLGSMLMRCLESLRIDFGLCKSKLHELTIYYGDDIHQLDLPALTGRAQGLAHNPQQIMSPRYIRALFSFIEGCQSILEVFLHSEADTLRVLPVLTMFRAPFAFKALAMLNRRVGDPSDNISQVIDEETVAWQSYSDGVREALEVASANELYAYPAMALHIRQAMVRSKKADQPNAGVQDFVQDDGTIQCAANDNAVTDPTFAAHYGLLPNQAELFQADPGQMSLWPADFIDFDVFPF